MARVPLSRLLKIVLGQEWRTCYEKWGKGRRIDRGATGNYVGILSGDLRPLLSRLEGAKLKEVGTSWGRSGSANDTRCTWNIRYLMARMSKTNKGKGSDAGIKRPRLGAAKLDRLIEEALVDAYGEEEQRMAFYTMLEDHLAMPFTTEVLGMEVTVQRVDLTDADVPPAPPGGRPASGEAILPRRDCAGAHERRVRHPGVLGGGRGIWRRKRRWQRMAFLPGPAPGGSRGWGSPDALFGLAALRAGWGGGRRDSRAASPAGARDAHGAACGRS
jgi:Calcium binding